MAKRKQKQTLREFRAWLQGVEELQPDGWSPNPTQWKLIRERIDGVIEEKVIVEKVTKTEPSPVSMNPIYQNGNPNFMAPPIQSSIPPGAVNAEMSNDAKQMLSPKSGKNAKTPDIDGSAGPTGSSFA